VGHATVSAQIVNIDSVVIAETPRIMPHAPEIRKNIAVALGCRPEQVSVKATTAERVGALAAGKGSPPTVWHAAEKHLGGTGMPRTPQGSRNRHPQGESLYYPFMGTNISPKEWSSSPGCATRP
jgi:hypothetical protein